MFSFTAAHAITNSELTFQMGGAAAYTLWLDNVSLVDNYGNVAGNPVSMTSGFYVDPGNNARLWKDKPENQAHPARQMIIDNIATKPGARWFGGWSGDIGNAVHRFVAAADTADKLPALAAYNIPGRDACGGHSSGGEEAVEAYKAWIETFAAAIGRRPALVILEPDSLGDFQCMDEAEEAIRTDLLSFAVEQFKDLAPNTWLYLDAANYGWGNNSQTTPADMAARLTAVGVANARGFSVNVSNYYTTALSNQYAGWINDNLATRKPFVVDTSRNGNGHNGEWCNPADRKLGVNSQLGGGAEMLLWIKVPGDSDGRCGIKSVDAGTFDPDLAKSLILGDSST